MAGATLISRFRRMMRSTRDRLGLGLEPVQGVEPSPQSQALTAGREEVLLDLTADAALEELLAIENGKLVPAPVLSPRKMLEKVEGGFDLLVELVGGMKESLSRQEARHAAAADVTDRLAQRMSMLPAAVMATARMARQNGEMLSALTRQIEAQIACQGQLVEALKVVPRSAGEHTAILKNIHDQLLLREELDHEMVGSMLSMNESLQQMSTTGTAQVDALGRLHLAHQEQADAVQDAVARQNRRFGWLFGFAIGICTFVLAGSAAIFIMLMR